MDASDLAYLSIGEAAAAIRSGAISPVELTQAALERIADLDGRVRAYVTVDGESPLDAAREAERSVRAGVIRGPLHGIPLAIKDIVDVAGLETTAGSRVLVGNVAHEDAALVAALRAAGAIVLGKTNTHEFAYGVVTPPTRNPWDLDRIPGGSSGGSAAALAAGMAYGAVGTDTAGSIRLPAALCGVVGLKPTYGRVSRHGVIPLSWSLDHAGPMTRSVRDAALLFFVMSSAYDPRDPATSDVPLKEIALNGVDLRGRRAGIPRTYFYERLEPDVAAAVEGALEVLAGLGMELCEVELPHTERTFGIGRAIQRPEASAYHGQRLRATPELYGEELRRDLELGELFLATDYIHAQRLRAEMRSSWQQVLNGLDVLVTPTVPAVAPLVQESATSGGIKGVLLRNTYPVNLVGFPALSLPCGRAAGGLPVGLQIIGRPFDEAAVLQVGHAYERATAWHEARPAL